MMLLAVLSFVPNNAQAANTVTVKIEYPHSWTGNIQGDSGMSVEGTGTKTYTVEGDIIAASAQKQDDSEEPLTISIIVNGKVEDTATTTAGYGVANVDYSFPVEDWEDDNSGACSVVFLSTLTFIGIGAVTVVQRRR